MTAYGGINFSAFIRPLIGRQILSRRGARSKLEERAHSRLVTELAW